MRLLFVRHGQTPANVGGVLETRVPGPGLTDLGQEQARALPAALADERIDALYVSTMRRTQLTAAYLGEARGLPLLERAGLREIASGDYEQHTTTASHHAYLSYLWRWADGDLEPRTPGGESGHEVMGRVDEVVAEAAASGHESVALVCHGALIRSWAGFRANLGGDFVRANPVVNTGIVVVEGSPSDGWRALSWLGEGVTAAAHIGADGPAGEPA